MAKLTYLVILTIFFLYILTSGEGLYVFLAMKNISIHVHNVHTKFYYKNLQQLQFRPPLFFGNAHLMKT